MKCKYVFLIIVFLFIANLLSAKSSQSTEKTSYAQRNLPKHDKYGFMVGYSLTNEGISAKLYGIPISSESVPKFSYFSLYIEKKGEFEGGEFDNSPLEFWENLHKDIYRKYLVNLGSVQPIIPSRKLVVAYYVGIGLREEYKQYKSIYGNYWYKNKNKTIGDIGAELIGRLGFLNLGVGASYQSLYYISLGFEF